MNTEKLEAYVKVRVTPTVKLACEELAAARQLAVADIVREALREYIKGWPEGRRSELPGPIVKQAA